MSTATSHDDTLRWSMIGVMITVGVLLLLSIILFIVLPVDAAVFFTVFICAPIVFFGLLVFGIVYMTTVSEARRKQRLSMFASDNGFTLQAVRREPDPGLIGLIFGFGHSRQISGSFGTKMPSGQAVEVGDYTYTVGSGKNQKIYAYLYGRLKLKRPMPHMLLDATSNDDGMFGTSNLPAAFSGDQKIQLEGDFNRYFTLYAPEQYKRDALYVMTPDVMHAMIDYGAMFDIEIVDDQLYIYKEGRLPNGPSNVIEQMLVMLAKMDNEIIDQAGRYSDERVGSMAGQAVATEGKRLKRTFSTVGIGFAVVIVVTVVMNVLNETGSLPAESFAVVPLAFGVFIVFYLISKVKRR